MYIQYYVSSTKCQQRCVLQYIYSIFYLAVYIFHTFFPIQTEYGESQTAVSAREVSNSQSPKRKTVLRCSCGSATVLGDLVRQK